MEIAGAKAVVPAIVALLLAGLPRESATASAAAPQSQAARPRLLVLVAVDQFRADYVDSYGPQWTAGLHRLFTRGAVFSRASDVAPTLAALAGITLPQATGSVRPEVAIR